MSSNHVKASGLEGRYAMALFALALEEKSLDASAKDLASLARMTEESEAFANLLKNPVLNQNTQQKTISAIAKKAKLQKLTAKFLGTLIANRRLNYLQKISASFLKLVADHKGEVTAEITSAQKLTKIQADALKKKLKKSLGQDISFDVTVDETLLGGLRVKVGSRVIDSSLKTKLENLTLQMKGV